MLILIPAFRPDDRLVQLTDDLRRANPALEIVVVDDGSGPRFRHVFDTLESGLHVLRHEHNRGKGAALRTGFAWAQDARPGKAIVTADADGQHLVPDILAVARRLEASGGDTIVLGCRTFAGDVPLRSRLGNTVARAIFAAASRQAVSDTQTGLRGMPARAIPFLLGLPGDRFDYELRMLLDAGRHGFRLHEVPIETVYLEENRSSHFRPVVDSLRVARPFIRFTLSSLLAFAIDALALWVLVAATGLLLIGVVGARILSASINFLVNRSIVFRQHSPTAGGGIGSRARRPRKVRAEAVRYGALALILLATNYAYLETLTAHGVPLLLAKVVTESVLFVVSFQVQRRLVFATAARPSGAPETPSDESDGPAGPPAELAGRTYSGRRASVSAPLSE